MTEYVPTNRELQILKVLWDKGEATVYQVAEVIDEGEELAYTTILSLLQIMERKGIVGHRRIGKAYAYFPKVEREPVFRNLADGFLEKVFDGAVDEYLLHVLQSHRLSHEDLDRIEALLAEFRDRMEQQRKKKR